MSDIHSKREDFVEEYKEGVRIVDDLFNRALRKSKEDELTSLEKFNEHAEIEEAFEGYEKIKRLIDKLISSGDDDEIDRVNSFSESYIQLSTQYQA